jgi:hypothetical protein
MYIALERGPTSTSTPPSALTVSTFSKVGAGDAGVAGTDAAVTRVGVAGTFVTRVGVAGTGVAGTDVIRVGVAGAAGAGGGGVDILSVTDLPVIVMSYSNQRGGKMESLPTTACAVSCASDWLI